MKGTALQSPGQVLNGKYESDLKRILHAVSQDEKKLFCTSFLSVFAPVLVLSRGGCKFVGQVQIYSKTRVHKI